MFLDELFQPVYQNLWINFWIPISNKPQYKELDQDYTRMSNIGRPRQLSAAAGSCLVDLFQLLSAKSQKISSKVLNLAKGEQKYRSPLRACSVNPPGLEEGERFWLVGGFNPFQYPTNQTRPKGVKKQFMSKTSCMSCLQVTSHKRYTGACDKI